MIGIETDVIITRRKIFKETAKFDMKEKNCDKIDDLPHEMIMDEK